MIYGHAYIGLKKSIGKEFRMKNDFNSHDADKLHRWRSDFDAQIDGQFPVYALFIVTGEDSDTESIFRLYRDVFETMHASFRNLVIFGQHGFSSVASELVATLGEKLGHKSYLFIFGIHGEGFVYEVSLYEPEDSVPAWTLVLENIQNLANGLGKLGDLGDIDGVVKKGLEISDISEWLDNVLQAVSN
jgi:hypothetical protein